MVATPGRAPSAAGRRRTDRRKPRRRCGAAGAPPGIRRQRRDGGGSGIDAEGEGHGAGTEAQLHPVRDPMHAGSTEQAAEDRECPAELPHGRGAHGGAQGPGWAAAEGAGAEGAGAASAADRAAFLLRRRDAPAGPPSGSRPRSLGWRRSNSTRGSMAADSQARVTQAERQPWLLISTWVNGRNTARRRRGRAAPCRWHGRAGG